MELHEQTQCKLEDSQQQKCENEEREKKRDRP